MNGAKANIRKIEATDGDSHGRVRNKYPKWFRPDVEISDRVRIHAERRIIASFAGQIAEHRYLNKLPRYGMHG
jgi:hypothetical protein